MFMFISRRGLMLLSLVANSVALSCCSSMVLTSLNRRGVSEQKGHHRWETERESRRRMRGRRGPFGLVVQRAGAAEVAIDNSAVGRVPVAMRTDSGILENVLEVGMSALSGWISGYILGSVIGFGGGLVKGPGAAAGAEAASNAVKGRLGAARAAAGREAGKWAGISSTFSFFGTATRVVRRKEDKWNNVISSCGAGAQLNRGKGAQGMLNGCASYSIFTYFIEEFLSPAAKVGDDSAYTVKPNSEPAPSKSTKKGKASRQ